MKLNLKWVTDIIGEDYKTWKNGDIIKIECQTGTGKTWFIKNRLLPHAINQGKTILYIANRINLKRQMKIDVAEIQGIEINYKDYNILDELEVIGNIVISSYQKIQNSILNDNYNIHCQDDLYDKYLNYDYIIWDECHFVVQDSAFNNKTIFFYDHYFEKCNKKCITILMSATMDYIKEPINKRFNPGKIIDYNTGIDYSYLDVFYFKNIDDIVATINNDTYGNKWLFFVNNIELAKDLLEKIKDSKFICSQHNKKYINKMDLNELNNIITNNKFDCKCLITTKSLDNGININDQLVKNIIILAIDKVDFIQMLGRKRIDTEYPQRVNLFIMNRSIKTFYTLLNAKYTKEYEAVELWKSDINSFNRKFDTSIDKLSEFNHLFYKTNSGWQLNEIGFFRLFKNIEFCKKMINKFYKVGKNAFIKEQLNWLKLKYYKDNWIEEVIDAKEVNKLTDYLKGIVGKKLFNTEKQELINMIGLKDGRGRIQKSISLLNTYLEVNKIPFIIISKQTKEYVKNTKKNKSIQFWKVINTDEINDF
jgi:hypothetical protein